MATSQIYGLPIFVKILLLAPIPLLISLAECHSIAQEVQELLPVHACVVYLCMHAFLNVCVCARAHPTAQM